MSRPATDRLKVNPPLGHMPALQYLPPAMLRVDDSYQRTLDSDASRTLVRQIAQYWNWDLCQPLVVARRDDDELYVIDGQHRLAAARLRGDIHQRLAVVVRYASAADEAASFVHLNQQRRPLTRVDLFKAAVASGDSEATAILDAVAAAGLTIAPHTNPTAWKPGQIANIGGIEQCWRTRGPKVAAAALIALERALRGQVLQYAGTMFPGIAAVVEAEIGRRRWSQRALNALIEMIGGASQIGWRAKVHHKRGEQPNLNFARAAEQVFLEHWAAWWPGQLPDDGSEWPDDVTPAGAGEPESAPDVAPKPAAAKPAAKPSPAPKPAFDWLKPGGAAAKAPAPKAEPKPEPSRGKAPSIDWGKVRAQVAPARLTAAGKAFRPDDEGKAWCDQCDRRRTWPEIDGCRDKHCSFGAKA